MLNESRPPDGIEVEIPPLTRGDEEILHREIPRFDFNNPPNSPTEIANLLARAVLTYGGIGLSANQLGLNHRAFVVKASPIIACFNPRVVATSSTDVLMEEGCLSYPGLIIKIKRPDSCRVRYVQPNGETITRDLEGLSARIFMHETDHLNGITILDRASRFHKDQALRKWKQWKRRQK